MDNDREILKETAHRKYPVPKGSWQHYQEWHGNIMLHWEIPFEMIQSFIPEGLELDIFKGEAWVSIIAFSVKNIRTKRIPPVSFLSDFHEVNLRTYVIKNGKPGIYFLSIEAQKWLPAFMARTFINLPYQKSHIFRKQNNYLNVNDNGRYLDMNYIEGDIIQPKTSLDMWLTERHCLYEQHKNKLFRIDIHHKEWNLCQVQVSINHINYPLCNETPNLVHFSPKISVLVWDREDL